MHFHDGRYEEACRLVRKWHYSRRPPSNVQFVGTWHQDGGLFADDDEPVAACFLSIPGTRWTEEVHELSRLVRKEGMPAPLTGLISQTIRLAARNGVDLVVSFADSSQNHHGGIYQAASWNYSGKRVAAMDGVMMDGTFIPGRSCNSRFGTRSPTKLQEMMPDHSIAPHWDSGKHLYWKALSKSGKKKAARLGLLCAAYPKPGADAGMFADVA